MKIEGKQIALQLADHLKKRVDNLKEKKIVPHLFIITFGKDVNTESYLKQKILRADQIGAKITLKRFPKSVSAKTISGLIETLNTDKKVNGIIVQRPLPKSLDEEKISTAVILSKDVDGFAPHSHFSPPVALAVIKAIESTLQNEDIYEFLKSRKIAIIGKGVTAGGPTIKLFKNLGIKIIIIDSKTRQKEKILKRSDVVISAVGKNILKDKDVKIGVILIGIGMHKAGGKLKGDYQESEIKQKVSFYTPTPGGIGPLNVTMLMKNLIEAAENQAD